MRTSQFLDRYFPADTILHGDLHMAKVIAELGTRNHYVYFLLAELDDGQRIVKVGTSAVLDRRMSLIKSRVPYKVIELLGQIEGDEELESSLHLAFHKFKFAKEWFYFDPIEFYVADFLQNNGVDPEKCFEKRDRLFSKIHAKISEIKCNS